MEIRNCPDCGEDTINTGLAFWPGIDEPVAIIGCTDDACGWVGVDEELPATVSSVRAHSAA
ncbi:MULTISPECIES: hypothetical protein [unclassified Salinibacterium]|uniref:hypothetical protein n=1 Tax=unclassified Salinibacterium TaxID=2632331 RepID=UPI0014226AD6|nr:MULTISPECIES: hypothetical protein [unclassified Salinibacterium]